MKKISNKEINTENDLEDMYQSIKMIIRNYMDKNKKNEIDLREKLKEIYFYINDNILHESNYKNIDILKNNISIIKEEIKNLNKQIKDLKEKAIFIPEDNEKIESDIKSTFQYLKTKLKEKDEKIKINELKYVYYIEEQNIKIAKLEEKLYKMSLKNLTEKKLKQIKIFPNVKQNSEDKLKNKNTKIPIKRLTSGNLLSNHSQRTRNQKMDLKQTFSENNILHNQIRLKYDFKDYQEKGLTGRLRDKPKNIDQHGIYYKIKEFNEILSHHYNIEGKRPLKISLKFKDNNT